jgi:para-aminobenzoate synthetase component 1
MAPPPDLPAPAPWSLFAAHQSRPFAFFLDRGDAVRPSFAGSRPFRQLVVEGDGRVRQWREGRWHEEDGDPIDLLAVFVDSCRSEPSPLPPWLEGQPLPRTVGYLAYDLGAWADGPPGLRRRLRNTVGTPLAVLSTYARVDAFDPSRGLLHRIDFADGEDGHCPPALPAPDPAAWTPTPRERYRSGFERIRAAIAEGEIYQANLSRRTVFDLPGHPALAYERLRRVQPVPWGAFLDFGGFALLSNSPECFLTRHGEAVATRPIKGTRPRRRDPIRDAAESEALRRDAKEKAEHLMIVDLERNDLGRVARTGSVEVRSFASVESFATVHHLVSEVVATVREGTGLAELLRATFPGGSITGAPKLRAMEILDSVEDGARGPYCGAIGFFDGSEQLELSIAIRTAVASEGRALYCTGGGIVADSECDREWTETHWKMEALSRALHGEDAKDTDGEAAPTGIGENA